MIDIENLQKNLIPSLPDRIDSKIEKNVSELIHKRFNEEGPWPMPQKLMRNLFLKWKL